MNQLTIDSYLEEVKSILNKLDKSEVKASYNTGFGIHIVNDHLGSECHSLDVLAHSIAKISPPKHIGGEEWFTAWYLAVDLVNNYIKKCTKSIELNNNDFSVESDD